MFSYRVLNYTKTKKKQQPPSNEIWYWASEKIGSLFEERWVDSQNPGLGGVNVISHTFEKGKGVITCDGDITVILNGAFCGCTSLTKVHLPEGLLTIHAAFGECTNLEHVIFPKSIEIIDSVSSFGGCVNLREIDLSNCVNLTVISGCFGACGTNHGLKCFDLTNCINLTTFNSSINGVRINRLSFLNCKSLTSINGQFNGINSIIDQINFKGCSGLTSITGSFGNMGGGLKNLNLSECPNLKTIASSFSGNGFGKCIIKTLTLGNYNDISISSSFANLLITKLNITPKIGIYSLSNSFNYCLDLKTLIFDCPLLNSISGCFMNGDIKFLTIKNIVNSSSSILGGNFKNNKTEELTLDSFGSYASYYLNSHISSFSPNIKRLNIKNMKFYAGSYLSNYDSLRSVLFENVRFDLTSNGFSFCKNLLSITFKNSYSESDYVGNFQGCESLREIDFSKSEAIKYINNSSFRNCTSLKSVKFNNNLYYIYGGAFENCVSLKSLNFGKKLCEINNSAFKGCTSLKSIKFGENLYAIYNNAFEDCKSLLTVDFSKCINLTSIYSYVFLNCKSLKKLNFDNCKNLNLSYISTSFNNSGLEYFSARNNNISSNISNSSGILYGTKLKTIDLEGSNVTGIYYLSPDGYTSEPYLGKYLENVNLKNCKNLTNINYSFYDCPKLKNINIEGCTKLKTIESSFNRCSKIKEFNLYNLGLPTDTITIYNSFELISGFKTLDLSNSNYKVIKLSTMGDESSEFDVKINGNLNLTSIVGESFSTSNVVKLEIKNCPNLTEISNFNMASCLKEIIIENCPNLTSIVGFNQCPNLEKITIKGDCSNLIIGSNNSNSSFINCPELKSVEINNVKQIIKSFTGCSKLSNIIINNIEDITDSFQYFGNIENLYIPANTTVIYNSFNGININNIILDLDNSTFVLSNNCVIDPTLNKIVLTGNNAIIPSEGDIIIEKGAFAGRNITNLVIPANVIQILLGAFDNISNIESITVDENNQYYDSRNDCNAIIETETNTLIKGCANTVIPDTVTTIDSGSFYGCDDLTSITIEENITSVSANAFVNCNNLTSIIVNSPTVASKSYNSSSNFVKVFGAQVTEYTFGSNVTTLGYYILCGSNNVTTVNILGDISETAQYSLNCSNLTTLNVSNIDTWSTRTSNSYVFCDSNTKYYDLYSNGSKITEIVIPSGTTTIDKWCFYKCKSLTSITIPDSVTKIDNNAFYHCSSLTSVNLSQVSSNLTSIGRCAFYYCLLLTLFTFPDNLQTIDYYAFYRCGLTNINIPDSVTSIDQSAFEACPVLSIIIGEGVNTIGNHAFGLYNNTQELYNTIESIVVSPNNTVYDSRNNCNALIKTSDDSLLYGCNNTIIPDDIVTISDYAFCGCQNLTEITIPNTVTNIKTQAFYRTGLTSVTIPSSVTSIGNHAFYDTPNLTSITINSNSLLSKSGSSSSNSLFYYGQFDRRYIEEIIIGDEVTNIGSYIFGITDSNKDNSITTIVIPDSVTSINSCAFYYCYVSTLYLGNGITTIGNSAFFGNKITNLYYNSNLESWLSTITNSLGLSLNLKNCDVYFNNEKVTEITIPNNITSIRDFAFSGFNSLINITIPNTVTSIGNNAFSNCSNPEFKIIIPSSVSSYGSSLFYSCDEIISVGISGSNSSIELPNNIKRIYSSMFSGCDNLTTVNIPLGVTSIESQAFYLCKSLENVVIPSSVTSISSNAFFDCTKLKSLIMYSSSNILISTDAFCYSSLTEEQALDLFKDLKIYVNPSTISYYKSQLPLFKTRIYPIS